MLKRPKTRQALIEAAEQLFGEHGIHNVSVRQIGAAIGSANNNVVSYHFGSKDALIDAIIAWRQPELNRQHGLALAAMPEGDRWQCTRFLLDAMWRPMFDIVDHAGHRVYARFLRTVHSDRIPYERSQLANLYASTRALSERIFAMVPCEVAVMARRRRSVVSYMMLDVICLADADALATGVSAESLFEDSLDMATAALLAPVTRRG